MDAEEFTQRWLGARLKRSGKPMPSAACPDCGEGALKPYNEAGEIEPEGLLVRCAACGWSVRLRELEQGHPLPEAGPET